MPLRLRVIPRAEQKGGDSGPASTERIVEFADDVDEIRIGRRSDLELTLPFKALSGVHARLRRQGSGGSERSHTWVIEDLESKNGTAVRGERIRGVTLLTDGDEIRLGSAPVTFRVFPLSGSTATAERSD